MRSGGAVLHAKKESLLEIKAGSCYDLGAGFSPPYFILRRLYGQAKDGL